MNSCEEAQDKIFKIKIPVLSKNDAANMLNEIKSDAINSAKNWKNFYKAYHQSCTSDTQTLDQTKIKLQLVEAVKNMYLADVKMKKVKAMIK